MHDPSRRSASTRQDGQHRPPYARPPRGQALRPAVRGRCSRCLRGVRGRPCRTSSQPRLAAPWRSMVRGISRTMVRARGTPARATPSQGGTCHDVRAPRSHQRGRLHTHHCSTRHARSRLRARGPRPNRPLRHTLLRPTPSRPERVLQDRRGRRQRPPRERAARGRSRDARATAAHVRHARHCGRRRRRQRRGGVPFEPIGVRRASPGGSNLQVTSGHRVRNESVTEKEGLMAEPVTVESNGSANPSVVGERTRARAAELWRSISKTLRKPTVGASVAGVTVLAAGAFWGVTEAVLAGAAAWAVFRTLKKRADKRKERDDDAAQEERSTPSHRNGAYPV
jgi:hypothetical protein